MLRSRKWYVVPTHGNVYQSGLPDLYCCHINHGQRWIEVKNPKSYHFTKAQLEVFPAFSAKGVGIWILVAATEEEYNKLLSQANWHLYLGHAKKTW